jgi:hypothetical protein
MKRAVALPAYKDVQPFVMPEGVIRVTIDPESLDLATPECPITREEVYIHGTEPTEFCPLHGGHMASDAPPASWLSRIFGGKNPESAQPGVPGDNANVKAKNPGAADSADNQAQPEEEKKKGLFKRIFGIFGGSKKDADKPNQETQEPAH